MTVGALEYFLGWLHFLKADGTLEQVTDPGRLRPADIVLLDRIKYYYSIMGRLRTTELFFLTGYVILYQDMTNEGRNKSTIHLESIGNQIDVRLTNAIIIFHPPA